MKIIINGKTENHEFKTATFYEIVRKAFGVMHKNYYESYTVTYSNGEDGAAGSLSFDDAIKITEGIIFNISKTTNA